MTLRLGTRGSPLARTQSSWVAERVAAALGEAVELVTISTEGDDVRIPLNAPPRPGAFVAALRDALLDGRVDLVVHSFKDMPTAAVPGLVVAATPPREDARDAWCGRGSRLADAPAGTRVGTSSPRRAAAVLRANPGLIPVPIRGNVDTRLGKIGREVDAVILAAAGLHRLGRTDAITEYLDDDVAIPAPAQGVLAVECREGDLAGRLAVLDDPAVRLAATAERAVLAGVGADCATAVGAWARFRGGELTLVADLSDHHGIAYARRERSAPVTTRPEAERLGLAVAADLLGAS